MGNKKIACLGGGSLYFTRLLSDLLLNKDLEGSEVTLYDIDNEKSERMAAMGQRLAKTTDVNFTIRPVAELSDAVDGADFAVVSIGGSGAEVTKNVYGSQFHNADIHIPAKYGIHQIIGDTCGPAGMMMAFRSIPAYMQICSEMEKCCPDVIVLSHSNPMAVLCRAMHKYTNLTVIGICHGVQAGIFRAAKILELPADELECMWIGTNHYYWFTRILHKGKDVYRELINRLYKIQTIKGEKLSAKLSQIYGYQIVYPEDDHIIEFYPFLSQANGGYKSLPYDLAASAQNFVSKERSMLGEKTASQEARSEFFKNYQNILDEVKLLEKIDNSITGEGVGSIISAIANGQRKTCIANIANNYAIPNFPATAEVEVEAVTDSLGVRAIQMGEAPLVLKGILEKRFVWQELVTDATVKGDRNLALQALMTDEMAIWPDKAEAMLEELLNASQKLLPQFFKN